MHPGGSRFRIADDFTPEPRRPLLRKLLANLFVNPFLPQSLQCLDDQLTFLVFENRFFERSLFENKLLLADLIRFARTIGEVDALGRNLSRES